MVQFRVEESADEEQGRWLWSAYASVFDDYANVETWYEKVWDTHRRRPGFRLACADAGDDIVGFAYGYTGQPGQWWTDNATRVLGPETANAWLGGHFEVVSVGVRPEARGRGIGRGLMQALTSELPHTKLLLMTTSDPSDPARRLYASDGWQVIGPGIGNDTVIMGKLPRGAPSA